MTDQKNLILAILLSVAIVFGFHFLYEKPRQEARQAELARQKALTEETVDVTQPRLTPGAAPVTEGPTGPRDRAEVIAAGNRIPISTPQLHGSINLIGGRIDDLSLANYHVTPDEDSPEVVLLSPVGTPSPYFAEFGWVGTEGMPVPGPETRWTADGGTLTPGDPLVLSWDNGQGLVFERVFAVDENFMFTVNQRVRNTGDAPAALSTYGRIQRRGTPETSGFFILHEGAVGVFDGVLQEFDYEDMQDTPDPLKTTGGWFGITDKYWLVSLIPDQSQTVDVRVVHQNATGADIYQVDYRTEAATLAPGQTVDTTHRLFAGAKKADLLDEYGDALNIPRFNYAVDWGWFFFLTIPFFHALHFLGGLFGNFGVAILVFTIFLRLLFFPLANKQYESFAKMKKLQPKMEELRKRFGEDRQQLSLKMMELYKTEKVNPLAGCLPILLQIPVFFALYKVLFVTIEMRHAPFFGWIDDLSAPDPTTIFNLFGLIPWDPPSMLMIGVWPLLMGVTMFLQQKLSPSNPDPVQQKVFLVLPFVFTFMMAAFPVGLVIYWTWSNTLAILQQWLIMRRMGVKMT
ncbi:membrane protein insertase YidC [Indioceanicola profundi]|uniref:membrane protein insertase YidC n=1 Tax=Indioceanicola profundi TaxID=2220096 RepID=UPI000E6AD4F8|nr:membrane protein insertase YidC [Indioceanicola profundi]